MVVVVVVVVVFCSCFLFVCFLLGIMEPRQASSACILLFIWSGSNKDTAISDFNRIPFMKTIDRRSMALTVSSRYLVAA